MSLHDQETHTHERTPTYVYVHCHHDTILESKRSIYITEDTLEYRGRKVLYCYTEAAAISFCSASGASYAGNMNVKGYVLRWKYATNEKGEALSEIQPVTDKKEQQEIRQLLWPSGSPRVIFDQ